METEVKIPARGAALDGNLTVPPAARGIVLFVHGSGSSRHSKRNRFVARTLNEAGLATLLFDLLTPEEEAVDIRFCSFYFAAYRLWKTLDFQHAPAILTTWLRNPNCSSASRSF
jgi:dienelactone hydrolase